MVMNREEIISNIKKDHRFAKKSLGQHFLTNELVVQKMVEASSIKDTDSILEIGPGLGILTREIFKSPAREIILVEKDYDLCARVREQFENKRSKVICQDAMILIPNLQVESPFKVISNLPYNVGSPILVQLLTVCPTLPSRIIVMLQKEVAERICAKPNNSNRGLLTVLIEQFGEAKIIEQVSKEHFYPIPKVDSAVISIENISKPDLDVKKAMRFIKMSFAGKRKKIKNSLFSTLKIDPKIQEEIAKKAGFDLNQRPEDLNRESWFILLKELEQLA
jgi:16S rRNA (adenine1518-N6/adenine1519-N6)-dimethyltransferase